MSKLKCYCGFSISDATIPSQTEGEIRTDQDWDHYETKIEETIVEYYEAVSNGTREKWLGKFFGKEYPLLPHMAVLADMRTKAESEYTLRICECEKCGRLYIQKGPKLNEYLCFEPREGKYEQVLKRKGKCE